MFGETDLRGVVARYLAAREITERDVVFVHLPDANIGQAAVIPATVTTGPRITVFTRVFMTPLFDDVVPTITCGAAAAGRP